MRPRKVANLPVGSFAWGREDDFQVQGRASDSDSVQWCRIEGIARARLLFRWIELILDWIPNVRMIDILLGRMTLPWPISFSYQFGGLSLKFL